MFPPIEFSFLYSESDKRIYTFLIHSVIREFERKLEPWVAFREHPISKVIVKPDPIIGCSCAGRATFQTDVAELRLPKNPILLEVNSLGALVAHEFGHLIIEEYFGETAEARILGNNLIHYWGNRADDLIGYKRFYTSRAFFRKYLFPFVSIYYPNLRRLIDSREAIQAAIQSKTAPRGINLYW